jgi:uncharacterized repeat protein (TIGR02543 family)
LEIPQKDSSTFDGWYTDPDFAGDAWINSDTVNSDITLYAKWTDVQKFRVTFNAKSGSPVPGTQDVIAGAKVRYPADPSLSNYKFGSWLKDGVEWGFNNPVTEAMELEAHWISNSINTRTVTYNSNGGTDVAQRTIEVGGKLTTPYEPTKDKALFTGWYKADNSAWNFGSDIVTEDITLTAHWSDIVTYTVTFYTYNGTNVSPIEVGENLLITNIPASPQKTGATFAGWFRESSYATPWNFPSDKVDGNLDLHAKWTHTVSFVPNGGNRVDPIAGVATGARIIAPEPAPSRTSATFDAWYKESSLTNKWAFDRDTVTTDTTLYAGWTHTVTFDVNGGNTENTIKTVKSGGTVTAPSANPTKGSATFDAWTTDLTLREEWDASTPKTANTTLYARWMQRNNVTFDSNGGSDVDTQEIYTGGKVTKPEDPSYGTAKFEGW